VGLAAGLVGAFGGVAIWRQRRELRLEQKLALAALAREREVRRGRLDKAATMLTLASGVAHELGTPLGVIVGRAEQLLERPGNDERSQRALRAILDQAGHINEVVRGFLELARGSRPALQSVAPDRVVAAALDLVAHRYAQAGVLLEAQLPGDLPALECEPRLLEHALVNLLLNACDASSRGGRVEVRVEREGPSLCFSVVDDGPGIPEADAARATEPFFTTKPQGKGTGLGLAIVAEIAKSHRGSLRLTPAAPHGTRAAVALPLQAEQAHG
jgi:signal transduction histidine kinase